MVSVASQQYQAGDHHAFVAISSPARFAIIVYFLFWRVMPTLATLAHPVEFGTSYVVGTALVNLAIEFLILLPMLLSRFAGSPIGWAHPLVFPALLSVGFGLLDNPHRLLAPIAAWYTPEEITDPLFYGWSTLKLLEVSLEFNVILLVALVSTYIGFSLIRLPKRVFGGKDEPVSITRGFIVFGFCFIVVIAFLQMQGGIIGHLANMAQGRFNIRESSGHFLVFAVFLPFLLIFLYLNKPEISRSKLFIALFLISCLMQFIVFGTRGGMFRPVAIMLIAWMLVNHRVPAVKLVVLAIIGLLLVGVLGDLRRSGEHGQIELNPLLEFDVERFYEESRQELKGREKETGLAVVAAVPEEQGYLWGESYLAAVLFFIPRSIWSEKPRAIGAYTAGLLYYQVADMSSYSGPGFPTPGETEAYWNFGIPGVFMVYMIFGFILRLAADWRVAQPNSARSAMFLILVVFIFQSFTSKTMNDMIQISAMMLICYFFIRRPDQSSKQSLSRSQFSLPTSRR